MSSPEYFAFSQNSNDLHHSLNSSYVLLREGLLTLDHWSCSKSPTCHTLCALGHWMVTSLSYTDLAQTDRHFFLKCVYVHGGDIHNYNRQHGIGTLHGGIGACVAWRVSRLYKVGLSRLNEELNLDSLSTNLNSNKKVLMTCKGKYQVWKWGGEPHITKSHIKSQWKLSKMRHECFLVPPNIRLCK